MPMFNRAQHVNSVDATVGQPIMARVIARKRELETSFEALGEHDATARSDISIALATINALLTGDHDHLPAVVVANMNRWLERNKHIAEHVHPSEEDFIMLTKIDELKDRVEARRLLLNASLVELRADARAEAAGMRDKVKARLSDLETTLEHGWENLTDGVKEKLNKWLKDD